MSDHPLVRLTAGALAGLLSKPLGGHGVAEKSLEDVGREAARAARAAFSELEADLTAPATVQKAKR